LALSDDGHFLFAVNPGSNELTSFLVTPAGLQFASKVPSGGLLPVSVATFGNLVYVANAGRNFFVDPEAPGTPGIAGFTVGFNGVLTPLEGSDRVLGAPSSFPAQVAFNADGTLLVVTELVAKQITVFRIEPDGRPGDRVENPSAGPLPFGFAFNSEGTLIVSEVGTPGSNDSSVSSYAVGATGELFVISAAIPTNQDQACWVANTPNARYAYTSNTGSGSVSGFRVNISGELTPLDIDGRTGVTGTGSQPIDMAISADGRYLDVMSRIGQAITTFRIESDGSLTSLASVGGLPPFPVGLAIGATP
jgi:6-phosphogluconolactonase (cycloisomerase 2 family)